MNGSIRPKTFEERCRAMNARYDLPANVIPTLRVGEPASQRLAKLKRILMKELLEIDDIILKAEAHENGTLYYGQGPEPAKPYTPDELEILTDIADLMVDMQVYEVSEMVKFGIPLVPVQDTVMDSNDSKLDADGKPIKDADGKFLKGPNYWKPEPRIRALLSRCQGNPA